MSFPNALIRNPDKDRALDARSKHAGMTMVGGSLLCHSRTLLSGIQTQATPAYENGSVRRTEMRSENLDRMIQLADEFFETRSDPDQISVTEETMEKLRRIHPDSLSEQTDEDGPIAWVLVIPTTHGLMETFVAAAINERDLLERTPVGGTYDALYLCSALVLPEYRGRGIAKRLAVGAVRSIQAQHPIQSLFYWSFSAEGEALASSVAREIGLPLYKRISE